MKMLRFNNGFVASDTGFVVSNRESVVSKRDHELHARKAAIAKAQDAVVAAAAQQN